MTICGKLGVEMEKAKKISKIKKLLKLLYYDAEIYISISIASKLEALNFIHMKKRISFHKRLISNEFYN